jgi:hypothetical protein
MGLAGGFEARSRRHLVRPLDLPGVQILEMRCLRRSVVERVPVTSLYKKEREHEGDR